MQIIYKKLKEIFLIKQIVKKPRADKSILDFR